MDKMKLKIEIFCLVSDVVAWPEALECYLAGTVGLATTLACQRRTDVPGFRLGLLSSKRINQV